MIPFLLLFLTASEDVPTFRTETAVVRVDAQVTTADGRDIPGLRAEDLVVYDEGERRPVLQLAAEAQPLDLVLVFDVSGSMYRHLPGLSGTTAEALRLLRSGDRAALIEFGSRAELIQALTTDRAALERRLVETMFRRTLGRGTATSAALQMAAGLLAKESPERRRAVLLVTDNDDPMADAERVLRILHGDDIVFSAIVTGNSDHGGIRALVESTGGTVAETGEPGAALAPTVSALRTRYTFEYAPPVPARGYRRIRIELAPAVRSRYPGAVITAREGYYAGQ